MTNILGIDPTAQAWQQDNGRSPAKDFAHELARHDEQAKPNLPNDAKANQDAGFENRALMETIKPEPASLPNEPASTASALEASVAKPSLAQELELAQVTVTPTGVTQALLGARVFGWHAMAQAYLSELTAADDAKPHAAAQAQQESPVSDTDEEAGLSTASQPAAEVATEVTAAEPQLPEATQLQTRATSDEAISSTTTELALADTSASSYWSERSLRFTRQRDGASVAWLRDFRISDAEASHLIQVVLSDAKAKGLALSKIMLNGREAWSSPTSH
jgi:hypothetical protein